MSTQATSERPEAAGIPWIESLTLLPLGAGASLTLLALLGLLAPLAGTTILGRCAILSGFLLSVWLGSRLFSGRPVIPLLATGLFLLAAPWLVPLLKPLIALAARAGEPAIGYLFRTLFSLPALILPGASLGVSLGLAALSPQRSWRHAALRCAALLVGAAFGAVLGGMQILPRAGDLGLALSGGGFLLVAGLLGLLSPKSAFGTAALTAGGGQARDPGLILTGTLALACLLSWERFLSQIHGPFPELPFRVLALFLSCAAAGSIALSLWPGASPSPFRIPLLALLSGIGVALPLAWLDRLPLLYLSVVRSAPLESASFALKTWGIGALLVGPAALAMGALLPMLICRSVSETAPSEGDSPSASQWVAALAGGGLLGAAVAVFWGLPRIGYERFLCSLSGFFLGFAALEFARATAGFRWGRIAGILTCFGGTLLIAWRLPAANPKLLSTAVYRYAPEIQKKYSTPGGYRDKRLLADMPFFREGAESTVAVESVQADKDSILAVTLDGTVAGTTYYDLIPQILAAEIPLLLHPSPERVFLAGYGTGIPAGCLLLHSLRQLDVAEMEPAVMDASHQFEPANRTPRSDSRLKLLLQDPRQALLAAGPSAYDAIVVRPGAPEAANARFLVTREFYQLAASRLRQGGLMAQAVPLQGLGRAEVASLVKTLSSVFKDVVVMQTYYEEALLLASNEPIRFDLGVMSRILSDEKIRSDLARVGVADPDSILIRYRLSGKGAELFAREGRILTDQGPPLAWSAFRAGGNPNPSDILEAMDKTSLGLADRIEGLAQGAAGNETLVKTARLALVAHDAVRAADLGEALVARGDAADGHQILGDACYLRQEQIMAVEEWHKALQADPAHGATLQSLAAFNADRRNFAEAESYLTQDLAAHPKDASALFARGRARFQLKKYREAESDLVQALATAGESEVPMSLYYLGMIQKEKGNLTGSAELLRRYLEWGYAQDRLTPVEADVHLALAEVYKGLNLPDLSEQQRQAGETLKSRLKKAANAQRDAIVDYLKKP
ncbi:MAG TPA: tetratricopeptide repeat protein [Candidatus Polarisedimenticolia bacterium]|nr:tetratricopeptide repeat protein [Candidatus Polarisedimenticolia bacterium]